MDEMSSSFPLPDDNLAHKFPVSVKGVILQQSKVVLLRNYREEWELPGGKLELWETPESCLMREIEEELGLEVQIGPLIDAWIYHIQEGIDVLIITYGCYSEWSKQPTISSEHKEAAFLETDNLEGIEMPNGYRRSISLWAQWPGSNPSLTSR